MSTGESGDVGGAFDANLFYVNLANISELNTNLTFVRDAVNNAVDGMYTNVEGLSDGWEGESYETYKSNLANYRPYLETYVVFIDAYKKLLDELRENGKTAITSVDDALDI